MDLADHFRVIAHNWWRILIVAALVAMSVYYVSNHQAKVYSAEAQLSVTAAQQGSFPVSRDDVLFLADTYAQRATTRPVVTRALKDGKINLDVFTAQGLVSATTSGTTGFLTITAEGPSPRAASRLGNALATALIADNKQQQQLQLTNDLAPVKAQIDALATQIQALPVGNPERSALETRYAALLQAELTRDTQPTNQVALVSDAGLPTGPARPKPLRDAVLGFLVALVIAAELSVAIESLSDRLPRSGDPEAIARMFGLPVLAMVPRGSDDERPVVEAFRTLRTSLAALPAEQRPKTITVVSAQAGAGKSYTAINLARSAAASQSGVLLVDADLRRPVIHQRLDVARQPGLSDVLGGRSARGAVHSVGLSPAYAVGEPRRFLVMPSGPPVPDPVVVLSRDSVRRVLEAVDESPNLTIFDTPPAALFGDATAVASQTDVTILILDARKSRLRSTRNVVTTLTRSGANILGIVVNRVGVPRSGRYYGS